VWAYFAAATCGTQSHRRDAGLQPCWECASLLSPAVSLPRPERNGREEGKKEEEKKEQTNERMEGGINESSRGQTF